MPFSTWRGRWQCAGGGAPPEVDPLETAQSKDSAPLSLEQKTERGKRSKALELMAATEAHTDYEKIKSPVLAIAVVGLPTNMVERFKTLPEPRRKVMDEFLRFRSAIKEKETERFRKELPSARVVVLTNANHACFIDREHEVLREMQAFLADSEWSDRSPHKSGFI